MQVFLIMVDPATMKHYSISKLFVQTHFPERILYSSSVPCFVFKLSVAYKLVLSMIGIITIEIVYTQSRLHIDGFYSHLVVEFETYYRQRETAI